MRSSPAPRRNPWSGRTGSCRSRSRCHHSQARPRQGPGPEPQPRLPEAAAPATAAPRWRARVVPPPFRARHQRADAIRVLFRFEEHDIFLPMIVLEELDGLKKGMTEVARNARQVSRSLDQLAGSSDIAQGLPPRRSATGGHRPAAVPDRAARRRAARACPGARPTTRSSAWCRRSPSASPSAAWCWCPGHQHARQGARSACRPRTTRTTRRSATMSCCIRVRWRCRPTLDPPEQEAGKLDPGPLHLLPCQWRWPEQMSLNQFVYFQGAGRAIALRARDRGAARPPCCAP